MARQHSSKDTRERVISAAVEKFMEKGYSKTTLEDIVQHVGLTRGAFYWNFESKKDILDEIVARYQQFYRNIYSSYRHFDSARDTLRDFLLVNLRSKNTMNPYVMIIRYKVEASQEVSNLTERQTEMDKTFLETIRKEVARGQQQQEFRTDKPAEMLALVLYTYLLGFESYNTAHHINAQGKFMPDEKIVEYVDFLMEMLQS
mgnify:FL=1